MSSKLNIYESPGETSEEDNLFSIEAIVAKMMCLNCDTKFVYIPILHSLESLNSE